MQFVSPYSHGSPENRKLPIMPTGKMEEKYYKKGAFERVITNFGDLITFDRICSKRKESMGLHGEGYGFTIQDIYAGLLRVYPVAGQEASRVMKSVRRSAGLKTVEEVYCDNFTSYCFGR